MNLLEVIVGLLLLLMISQDEYKSYDETQRWGPWYLSEMEEKWWRIKLEKRIKTLRSDNGGEYTSDPFFEVC
jgi:hypothetical protein